MLFGKFKKSGQILVVSLVVINTLGDFMIVPEDSCGECVESHGFDGENSVFPILDGHPAIVYLCCNNSGGESILVLIPFGNSEREYGQDESE